MVEGTVYSRDPKTGLKRPSGSICIEGVNTPEQPLPFSALQQLRPELASRLVEALAAAENRAKGPVCMEFKQGEQGLSLSESRPLDGPPSAQLRILQDLLSEGLIDESEVVSRLQPQHFVVRDEPAVREYTKAARSGAVKARGRCVFAGAAVGVLVDNPDLVWETYLRGEPVVLLLESLELCHRDDLLACSALLLRQGGRQVPVRIPCLADIGDVTLCPGTKYTVWAEAGEVLEGELPLLASPPESLRRPLLALAASRCPVELRANFEGDSNLALMGSQGVSRVGLARVETFFQSAARLEVLRQALVAAEHHSTEPLEVFEDELVSALMPLLEFLSHGDQPVATVRLFDSPLGWTSRLWTEHLHWQPPSLPDAIRQSRHELSATLGLRGGRFSRLFPMFFEAQVRALARASERYPGVRVEMMLPGIGAVEEAEFFVERARTVWAQMGLPPLRTGMMLEIPRACLLADQFLPYCEFFSFGTGDLSEATWSLSRYDAPLEYLSRLPDTFNPFEELDLEGVGALMRIACERLRTASAGVEIGWCGAQAAHHCDLDFVKSLQLSYLSVSVEALAKVKVSLAGQAESKKKASP